LFTNKETDLLTPLRKGENINSLIQETVLKKKAVRAGLTTQKEFENLEKHAQNRSMIRIGG
jgi:cyclic pyranopterin phosphate synthase